MIFTVCHEPHVPDIIDLKPYGILLRACCQELSVQKRTSTIF